MDSFVDSTWVGVVGTFLALGLLLALAKSFQGEDGRKFLVGFIGVFLLATLSYTLAAHSVVKSYNLEYALWALGVGLIISNDRYPEPASASGLHRVFHQNRFGFIGRRSSHVEANGVGLARRLRCLDCDSDRAD